MRAKHVMSANLTRTKTEENRYHVDALDFHQKRRRIGFARTLRVPVVPWQLTLSREDEGRKGKLS
jgi:hypothetical protein